MPAPKNNTTEDKFQISLIPLDIIIPMLEPAYREGVLKYERESWRLGFNSTVMYDALMRHLKAWFFDLESCDPEAKEKYNIDKHHLGAAMFCLINLYNTEKKFPHLDDRPLKQLEDLSGYVLNELDEEDSENNIPIKTLAEIAGDVYNRAFQKEKEKNYERTRD